MTKVLLLFGVALVFCCLTESKASSFRFVIEDDDAQDDRGKAGGLRGSIDELPTESPDRIRKVYRNKRETDFEGQFRALLDKILTKKHNLLKALDTEVFPALLAAFDVDVYIDLMKNIATVKVPPEILDKMKIILKIVQQEIIKILREPVVDHYSIIPPIV